MTENAKNAIGFLKELVDKIEAGKAEVLLVEKDVRFPKGAEGEMRVEMILNWKEGAPR
jgi:hypothetical protein